MQSEINPIKCIQQSATSISVNQFTQDPDRAWDRLKNTISNTKIENVMPLDAPILENKVKK
jgi:hypothetical protein